jgi:photosystem II stability/assembly factor-like uncharacterized protein
MRFSFLTFRIPALLTFTAVLAGCRTGTLSPQYSDETAPLMYEVQKVVSIGSKQSFSSIFGTGDGRHLWVAGSGGTILESSDGVHWAPVASTGTNANLRSIFGSADGQRLWAVGSGGTILQSGDGENWVPVASTGTQEDLYSIFGTADGKRLWVGGAKGTVLYSSDGTHWTSAAPVFGNRDGKHFWTAGPGGTILQSSDDAHWAPVISNSYQSSGSLPNLYSIYGTSDGKRLWAATEVGIYQSVDGNHWTHADVNATYPGLESIFGIRDGTHLWAVGSIGTILQSSDGDHWTHAASFPSNDTFHSLFGTNDGKHLWAVGSGNIILQSRDGDYWTQVYRDAGAHLWSVYGTQDGKHFWAVSDRGTIFAANSTSLAPFVRRSQLVSAGNSGFVLLTMSNTSPTLSVSLSAENDYDFHKNDSGWSEDVTCTKTGSGFQWRCPLNLSSLHPEYKADSTVVPVVHCFITVRYDGAKQTYDDSILYYPFSFFDHPLIATAVGVILFLIVIPSTLLFVRPLWNVALYRTLKLVQIEKIDIPGIGSLLKPALHIVTVLPWFVQRRRTLDAWVLKNRATILKAWNKELESEGGTPADSEGDNGQFYVPLPIRKGNPRSGEQILQPSASNIRVMVTQNRATIQIIGPGGAGKTSLAKQISRWTFENGRESGIAAHPIIPVWVDEELDPEKNTLPAVVKGKLVATLSSEDIDSVLLSALLEKQRLAVFIDRLSERSVVAQRHIETAYRSSNIGLLILTSRTGHKIDGVESVFLYPEPLNSATLLRFMTDLLAIYLGISEEGRPFATIEEQCDLGKRLAKLIQLRTGLGEHDVPLIPLPVRLFVEQAVQLVRESKSLDDLPSSLPEVYLRQIRIVNPQNSGLPNFFPDDPLLEIAQALAKISLRRDFIPKEFSRSEATKIIGEPKYNSDPLQRLVLNGVLVEKPGGKDVRFRFSLDPVAEFLAAVSYGEDCGPDDEKWRELKNKSASAPGFQVAIELVRQAYWPDSYSESNYSPGSVGRKGP